MYRFRIMAVFGALSVICLLWMGWRSNDFSVAFCAAFFVALAHFRSFAKKQGLIANLQRLGYQDFSCRDMERLVDLLGDRILHLPPAAELRVIPAYLDNPVEFILDTFKAKSPAQS